MAVVEEGAWGDLVLIYTNRTQQVERARSRTLRTDDQRVVLLRCRVPGHGVKRKSPAWIASRYAAIRGSGYVRVHL